MTPQTQAILQGARVAELRSGNALAELSTAPAGVAQPRMPSSSRDRAPALLLLARERDAARG